MGFLFVRIFLLCIIVLTVIFEYVSVLATHLFDLDDCMCEDNKEKYHADDKDHVSNYF